MPQSILEAIKSGDWDYEPEAAASKGDFDSTDALPGSLRKLEILAERIRAGLPLWHPEDRLTYELREVEDE